MVIRRNGSRTATGWSHSARSTASLVIAATALTFVVGGCTSDDSTGGDDPTTSAAPTTEQLAPGDAPQPTVRGPIENSDASVPFNSMPEGMAEEAGYVEEEFFFNGEARSFEPSGTWGTDGKWAAEPAAKTVPYTSRMVVRRPEDATKFNGTVVVEWLNVSAGMDSDPDFGLSHEEILRSGYAYVVVSAQKAGVMGGGGLIPIPGFTPKALRELDPERYGDLNHPGDDYSYDIFAQAAQSIRTPNGVDPLDGLPRERMIATGESQSAFRMLTFANAVQPITNEFDGILIHSRSGNGDAINKAAAPSHPAAATVRTDTKVPVMQVATETDLFILGFLPGRQPDSDMVRTWEIAGSAHADKSVLDYGIASGIRSYPGEDFDVAGACGPINVGPQKFVMRKVMDALNTWVADGTAPAKAPMIETEGTSIKRDEIGNALGGIRLPAVDAPTATINGETNTTPGIFCTIFGSTTPLSSAEIKRRYPTHDDYVAAVEKSAEQAVSDGFLLEADAQELVETAAAADIPADQ